MKLTLLAAAVAVALVCAAPASARYIELGAANAVNPTCPAERCPVLVQLTGYQGRAAGGSKNPFYIRRDGFLTAFTINLGQPTAEQITYFNDNFGSPSQVRISVLRRGRTRRNRLSHRLISQSEVVEVDDYFGSSPTFVLRRPLRVKRTNWIALTVPTWAPSFAVGLGKGNWWRSSRPRNTCDGPESLEDFALQDLRDVATFGCTYGGAKMLYTVTYVPDPRPTADSDAQ